MRIEKAKKLLEHLGLHIAEIAEKVGYEDANYFSQVFKKVTGLRPSAYRQKVVPSGKIQKFSRKK